MTLEERLVLLTNGIGGAIKALKVSQGDMTSLATTHKATLVGAINEIRQLASSLGGGSEIDDSAGNGDTGYTWSADKIFDAIATMRASLKDEILGGAGAALDTLQELASALGNDPSFATTIVEGLNNRVRFDQAQVLTGTQRLQACENIGIGDPDVDLVAVFNAAVI